MLCPFVFLIQPQILKVLLLLSVSKFVFVYACWGWSEVDEEEYGMLNPHNKDIWNGWDAPPNAQEAWDEWLQEYKENTVGNTGYLTEEEKAAGVLPAGHGVPDWPRDWNDLQEGFGGMTPPPWAYVPKNYGRPPHCYARPTRGPCEENHERFGYNPFMDQCQTFIYSGCGGNGNNFVKKEDCEKDCVNPMMGCDPDSDLPVFGPGA